jgi:hypothetical protein
MTGGGKIKRASAFKNHILNKKTRKTKRNLRAPAFMLKVLTKIFGSRNERLIKQYARTVVRKLSIWRDIYYSRDPNELDAHVNQDALMIKAEEFRDLARQGELHSIIRAAWLAYYPSEVKIGNESGNMGSPRFYPKVDASHPSDRFNADEYFMLGDNRDNSLDSRYWGFVPDSLIRGRPLVVYYSFQPDSGAHTAWLSRVRWHRLGSRVH